jgi:acyl-CoA hydrolase
METRIRPQPEHANNGGTMHGGYILYHIDTCCGMAAMRHAGMNVVTAAIDRMDFARPVHLATNMVIKSSVNMVHRSSLEVGARVEEENSLTGERLHVGTAYLTFVALGEKGRPSAVPPLIPETDEDRRRMADAARRAYLRRMERARSKGKDFSFTLELLAERFYLCGLAPGSPLPVLPRAGFALCAAADNEITLVFPDSPGSDEVMNELRRAGEPRLEKGRRAFAVRGKPDSAVPGAAAALCSVLAAEAISVQYVSTFSAAYLLVGGDVVDEATEALRLAGHTVSLL